MKSHLQTGTVLILIIGAILLLFFALQKLAALIVLLLIALVITAGIDPIVKRVQLLFKRWKMPRSVATFIVLLLGLIIILGAISYLVSIAVMQAISFAQNQRLQTDIINWVAHLSDRYPFIPEPGTILERIQAQSGQVSRYLWTTTVAFFGILGSLFSVVTVFILVFFFTTYKDGIVYTLMQFVPPPHQQLVRTIGHNAAEKMGGWLRGQLLLALIITVLVIISMIVINYPGYAILVGIIGGLGELIPMVGPYLAFFPALAIVVFTGGKLWQIIVISIFFIILSQAENYILAPRIMERKVGLHPVTTILALLIGGSLLGLVGALLAIPLAAAGRVILIEGVFPVIQRISPQQIERNKPEAVQQQQQQQAKQRTARKKNR